MDEPIPFITVVDHGSDARSPNFAINQKAVDLLNKIEGPVGVVTIAGLYRTGKSYVLNRLAGSNRGFAVGSLIEPCTQGIYMWIVTSPPAGLALNDPAMTLILLDTEGLGSYTKSKTYDVKIFTLAVLLSSMFMYNSMGSIDESALDRLSLVAELSNNIRLQSEGGDGQGDAFALGNFFPQFVWLVRDFGLRLELNGQPITSNEYLENVLKPLEGDSDKVKARNGIRSSIVQYFRTRHCFTIKRPVVNEEQLRNLEDLAESDLRPAFLDQMSALTSFVYHTLQPKSLFAQPLTGSMWAQLATSYVTALNLGSVPVIRSAWENVLVAEARRVVATLAREWDREWSEGVVQLLPMDADELDGKWAEMQAEVLGKLYVWMASKGGGDIAVAGELVAGLKETMAKAWKSAKAANYTKSARACESLLHQIQADWAQALDADVVTFEQLEASVPVSLQESYFAKSIGPAKHAVLADFLQRRVLGLAKAVHGKIVQVREREMTEELARRVGELEQAKDNTEALLRDMKASFLKSREEVAQLAAENQQLIKVVARFSDVLEEEDMRRGK
ncbi:hypothetical protein GGF31_007084 [Allomyces arbusculus]|nr:hypothetical protein GGF31_007084 [Allomyces arbusculus]